MRIARTLKNFLQSQKIDYGVLEHRYAEGSHDTAQRAQVPARQLLKGVVFRDEDFFYTMAIVPAHHRVLRHTLNEILGRHLVLADEEELRRLFFDCEPGAIPSFGQAYGLNIIWDDSLGEANELWAEAGDHKHLLHLNQQNFNKLMQNHLHDTISSARKRLKFKASTRAILANLPPEARTLGRNPTHATL